MRLGWSSPGSRCSKPAQRSPLHPATAPFLGACDSLARTLGSLARGTRYRARYLEADPTTDERAGTNPGGRKPQQDTTTTCDSGRARKIARRSHDRTLHAAAAAVTPHRADTPSGALSELAYPQWVTGIMAQSVASPRYGQASAANPRTATLRCEGGPNALVSRHTRAPGAGQATSSVQADWPRVRRYPQTVPAQGGRLAARTDCPRVSQSTCHTAAGRQQR